ncbi:dihydroorotase [Natranaerofaba carboxydovora]|uniref:dihydroorotase n=1 Tax=Natranaerofaba carboxydovora TaxID=2742683 RepID=UPI001F13C1C2|nr:dihydroorotase family protein [Natranaerofaba carboxydovora]UMZ73755.1 Allantoinase [Natranaerofaba carboxydovora]
MIYDLVLKNARIVDYSSQLNDIMDIGIKDNKIIEISRDIITTSKNHIDLSDKIVIPGIIDVHVHISSLLGGPEGHKMMAKSGVTTAIDFAGPLESVIHSLYNKGSGLNIGCLESLRPGYNLSSDADKSQVKEVIDDTLKQGAMGIKIMGGHYPLSKETTKYIFEYCNEKKVIIAFHAGTLSSRSDLRGFREAVELAGDYRVYIPHVNSYCRGMTKEPLDELKELLQELSSNDNIISGSYLAKINATSGYCTNGEPLSKVTQNCLKIGGYDLTKKGLEKAITDGFAMVNAIKNDEKILLKGENGVQYWLDNKTDTTVSFPVNLMDVAYLCATSKDKNDEFIVDMISTDGGGIPRNVSLHQALLLVKFGAFSILDMANKMSYKPAKVFGFENKGFIKEGADADLTVIDYDKNNAYMTIAGGNIIMIDGTVIGEKGTLYTTDFCDKEFGNIKTSKIDRDSFYLDA